MRLEQNAAKGGAEREGDEAGKQRRHRDCQRELPVELTRDSADECRRDENRTQHKRDGYECAADLFHGLDRRLAWREAFSEVALDAFDHDDRIVHHDADGEHESEQRKIVERETEDRHDGKRPDERDGNRRESE